MKHIYFSTKLFAAILFGTLCSVAQESTAPASYSFTISGSQVWTDTGVDLAAGDDLSFTAEAKPGTENSCSPAGVPSASSGAALPMASSASGAVIAKTAEKSDPILVGNKTSLKAENTGHLFLGINQNVASSCAFSVKVQITQAQNAPAPAESSAKPTASATQLNATQPAASPNATDAAAHPDIKTQLSSAAQVWLKGQFGSSSSSTTASSSNAVSGTGTGSSASTPTSGSKLAEVILDVDLRQHVDGLPRRVHDHAGNLGDMVNFVMIGSQERVQAALDDADWHLADLDSKESGLKAILDTYQKKEYLQMPMSHLYLFDRMQDFGYEQAQAFAVVATRHHFRIWKAPFTWNNEVVWVGAATHDIGFEKDVRTGKLTHKIDPDIDLERTNLAQGLDKSGKTKDITYYLPPDPVQEAKNASGGGYHSDGRLLVVFLK